MKHAGIVCGSISVLSELIASIPIVIYNYLRACKIY